jgi:hypothetical protein
MSKSYQPCQCNTQVIDTLEDGTPVHGSCGAQTKSRFAPGHDARLKGTLLKLIRSNQEYTVREGGALTSSNPATVLTEMGWAKFNVEPKAKVRKPKAEKANDKAGFHPVRVKLGRWIYDANVVSEDVNELTVSYQDKKGNTKVVEVKRSALVQG